MTSLVALALRQGDTYTQVLTITATGVAVNLTGSVVTIHLRAPGATADTLAVALVLTTPTSGIATLTLTAAQTAALNALTTYAYEIEVVDSLSNVTTPVAGLLFVEADGG